MAGKQYSKNEFKNISNQIDEQNPTNEERKIKQIYEIADKLELHSRTIKDRETNGIPIEPDTSHIISEIILSEVDRQLYKKYDYIRYIDDYHCFVETEEKAKEFLKDLEKELDIYHLELNDKKTEIKNILNITNIDNKKIRMIRNFTLPNLDINNNEDFQKVLDLLDFAKECSVSSSDFKYLRYALLRLKNINFTNTILLEIFCKKVFNIVLMAPYLIRDIRFITEFAEPEFRKKFLETIILENISYKRSDVLVFAIYFSFLYEIKFKDYEKIKDKIFDILDPLSTLILFIYAEKNNKNLESFYEHIKNIDSSEWWIYIYELYKRDKSKVLNYKNEDLEYSNFYHYLIDNNISFLNPELNSHKKNYESEIKPEDLPF